MRTIYLFIKSNRIRVAASVAFAVTALVSFQNCTTQNGSSNSATQQSTVVQKGSRVLGMDVNDSAQDTTFNQGFTEAQNMGVVGVDLLVDWSSVETTAGSGTTPGTYVDPNGELATANAFYPANGASISLNVAPIDMGKFVVPSDLAGKTLDDLTLINRYLQMIDFVLSKLPNANFVDIQVGNEIDSSSQANTTAFWTSYYTFLSYVVPHLHSSRPGVKVGVTATFHGAVGVGSGSSTTKAGFQQLAKAMDEVGITYYPLTSSYIVEDVSVVATDFNTLTSSYTVPIYIEEAGYPTSSTCGGSQAQQAAFISAVFQAWDSHVNQIPYLSFLRLNDWSLATAQAFAPSGPPALVAYLQTLGLRTWPTPSADKQAIQTLRSEASSRGWPVR